MDTELTLILHLTEEVLEEYCFDRLSAEMTGAVEEHLLVCSTCQELLRSLDEFIQLLRMASRDDERTLRAPSSYARVEYDPQPV